MNEHSFYFQPLEPLLSLNSFFQKNSGTTGRCKWDYEEVNSDLAVSVTLFYPETLSAFKKCPTALNSMSHAAVSFPCFTLILH